MPFALVLIGLIMIVTGVRSTYKEFGGLLVKDFTGDKNFTFWIASLGAVGAMGYVKELQTFSRAFMFLIILGMIIRNGGFFDKLTEALNKGPVHVSAAGPDSSKADTGIGGSGISNADALKAGTTVLETAALLL